MKRMYVEAPVFTDATDRDAVAYLMRQLDDEAAKQGHRVVGQVSVLEGPPGAFTKIMRLEADVEPAV